MGFNRISDSMSRCDPNMYSNIYDVRTPPVSKPSSISTPKSLPKDTIEISRNKLKQEALSRLRHSTKYLIPQNSFIRIGKYLFLAVTFPPYLLFYGLPKWIFIEALPAAYSFFVWIWKKSKQKIEKPLENSKNYVNFAMQMLRNQAKILVKPLVSLYFDIRQKWNRIKENVIQFFFLIPKQVNKRLRVPFTRLKNNFQRIQKKLGEIRQKLTPKIDQFSNRLEETIQWVKQAPQLFLGWGQNQVQHLNRIVNSLVMKWNKPLFQKSQHMASEAKNWIAEKFEQYTVQLKCYFQPLVNLYCQQILPKINRFIKISKAKWRLTKDFFQQNHQRALALLQRKQDKFKKISSTNFIDLIFSQGWIKKLPFQFQIWLKKWLSHPLVKPVCEISFNVYCFIARAFLFLSFHTLHIVGIVTKKVSQACQFLSNALQMIIKKVMTAFWAGYVLSRKFVLQGLYYFLLCTVIVGILFIWLGNYLGEQMKALSFALKPHLRSK